MVPEARLAIVCHDHPDGVALVTAYARAGQQPIVSTYDRSGASAAVTHETLSPACRHPGCRVRPPLKLDDVRRLVEQIRASGVTEPVRMTEQEAVRLVSRRR